MSVTYNQAAMAFIGSTFDSAAKTLLRQGLGEEQVTKVALVFNEVKQEFPKNLSFEQQISGKGEKPSLLQATVDMLSRSDNIDFLDI